jgi:membrane protease YdiL (CAAX protease family)
LQFSIDQVLCFYSARWHGILAPGEVHKPGVFRKTLMESESLKFSYLKGLWIIIGYLILFKALIMGVFQTLIPQNDDTLYKSILPFSLEALSVLFLIWLLRFDIRRKYESDFNFNIMGNFKIQILIVMVALITGYFFAFRSSLGLLTDQISMGDYFTRFLNTKEKEYAINPWPIRLSMVVLTPVFEEAVIRGVVLRAFLNQYKPMYAILFSGILFGITHIMPAQIIGAVIFGILIGYVYFATGSLLLCILIHALHNALAIYADSIHFEFNLISFAWGFLLFLVAAYLFIRLIPEKSYL